MMTRTENVKKNLIFNIVKYITQLLTQFGVRTALIYTMGIEYLGLNGLFANVFTFLNLAELGIGSAIVFSMYKPIADNDVNKIKALQDLYKKFYLIIALVVTAIGGIIAPFIKVFINGDVSVNINLYLLFIMYLVNAGVGYLSAHKRSLLFAYQKVKIENIIKTICLLLSSLLQILILFVWKNYYVFFAITILFTIVECVAVHITANKLYPEIRGKGDKLDQQTKKEISKNVVALSMHKIGGAIVFATDNILISAFLGVVVLGAYSNYALIITSIQAIISLISNVFSGSVGNLIASKDEAYVYERYKRIRFIYTFMVTFCTICLLCLTQPFITVWTNSNPDYQLNMSSVVLLCISFYLTMMRSPVALFKDCAGLYWNDRWKPIAEAGVNLLLSIVFAQFWGVNGVILGTILSTLSAPFWVEPLVLFKRYFKKNLKSYYLTYLKETIIAGLGCAIGFFICSKLPGVSIWATIIKFATCIVFSILFLAAAYWFDGDFKNWRRLIGEFSVWKKFKEKFIFPRSQKLIYILCFVLMALSALSCIYEPIAYVVFVLVVMLTLLRHDIKCLYYIFAVLPFLPIISLNMGSSLWGVFPSTWVVFFFVLACSCSLLLDILIDENSIKWKAFVPFVLAVLYCFVPFYGFSISQFIKLAVLLIACFFCFYYRKDLSFKNIVLIFAISFIVASSISILRELPKFLLNFFPNVKARHYAIEFRFSGLYVDPNYYATEVVITLCCLGILFYKNALKPLTFYMLFGALSCLGLYTISKTFVACYILLFLSLLALLCFNKKDNKKCRIVKPLVLCLVCVVVFLVNYVSLLKTFQRFTGPVLGSEKSLESALGDATTGGEKLGLTLESITTGRVEIWKEYLKDICSSIISILFGKGVGAQLLDIDGTLWATHNFPLEILYYLGVFGLLFATYMVFSCVKGGKYKIRPANILMLMPACLIMCSVSYLYAGKLFMLIYLMFNILVFDRNENVNRRCDLSIKGELGMETQEKNLQVDNEIVLSVILPVYNVSKYLENCVESIVKCNMSNYEIILVDDGSTDGSGILADKLSEKYQEVKVLHQVNMGVSDARNSGVKVARGKYLSFIDSDDSVNQDYKKMETFLNDGYDIIFAGYNNHILDVTKKVGYDDVVECNGNDEVIKNCLKIETKHNSVWSKIIKKDFFIQNELWFKKSFAEDFNWVGRAIMFAQKTIIVPVEYYEYIAVREGSLMNTYKIKRFCEVIDQANDIVCLLDKQDISAKLKKRIRQFVGFNVLSNFRHAKKLPSVEEYNQAIDLLIQNKHLINCQKSLLLKSFVLFGNIIGFKRLFKMV